MKKEDLIGKHLLIGISVLDAADDMIEQYQTHGTITAVDDQLGIVIEKADGSGRYILPPDPDNIYPAEPGEYRIRTTGEIVSNPDFTSTWAIYETDQGIADDYKKTGFRNLS